MATRPIDEKIVVMKLDNSDFSRKAAETTGVLGKLRDSLNKIPGVNLGKTAQELGAISKESNNINMNALSNSIQGVADRFKTMGVVATTTLATITNQAVNAGMRIAKSLSIQPAIDGFREYETKIGAIGTVLANTEWAGTGLNDVKGTLEELNTYADETIYSFSQMTQNIGRFTAAGVRLEDSAIAIKGLSNLAAASGSNAEQLNSAMYQMSQAMAAGKLNLMDWNSLVNAGMAGKKTQDALVATAKAMGKNVDLTKGFRDSIHKGWLTSEVFLETLKKFGTDKSMTEAATSVRSFTAMISSLKEGIGSGWATTFEHIFGDFEEATKFWTKLSNSIKGFFDRSAEGRNKLFSSIASLGGMDRIFEGIQNAVKPIGQIFKAVGEGFREIFPPAGINRIMELIRNFQQFTVGLKLSKETTDKLKTVFAGVFAVFSSVWEIAKSLGKAFKNLFPPGLGGNLLDFLVILAEMAIEFNKSLKAGNALTSGIDTFGAILGGVGKGISGVIDLIGKLGAIVREKLGKALEYVKETFSATFGEGIGGDEIVGAGTIAGLTFFATKIMSVFGIFGDDSIIDQLKETFEGITDAIQNFALGIKITNLLLIAIALGILAASLKTLENIKVANLAKGLGALAIALGIMIGGMMLIDKFNVTGGIRASLTLIALATAVNIMASALVKLADLDPEKLSHAIGAIVVTTGALAAAVIALSKWGGKIKVGSVQLIALASAVYILASAVEKMAEIEPGALFKALGALALIFAQLALFLIVVDKSKFRMSSALGVLAIAGALNLMVFAVRGLGELDIKDLAKGLGSIAILLAQIIVFSKLINPIKLTIASAGLLLVSIALNALVPPIETLGKMSMVELAKGLGAMAVALAAVVGAAILMQGGLLGAVGITAMAGALMLLMVPIQIFANMTWGEMLKAFVGLAGGMTLIAAAALLLTPAVVPMLAFGAGLLVMGVAILAAGAGLSLFAAGLAALATMTIASVASIVSSLALMLQGLHELLPAVAKFTIDLATTLIKGFGDIIPLLVETAADIILNILITLYQYLPRFLELGVKILTKLMAGLEEYLPTLINSAMRLMTKFIEGMAQGIRDNGPQLTSAVLKLLGEVFILIIDAEVQIVNALLGWIPGVSKATNTMGETLKKDIRKYFDTKTSGEEKGKDLAKGLTSKKRDVSKAGEGLAIAGKDGIGNVNISTAGASFGDGFANGITSKQSKVGIAAQGLAQTAANKIASFLGIKSPAEYTTRQGRETGEGFSRGISSKTKDVEKAAEKVGKSTGSGYSKGVESSKEKVKSSAKSVGDTANKAFNDAMKKSEYRFKMEKINSAQYIAEIEKIKRSYAKYPELVREANLEIKKIEEDAARHREDLRKKEEEARRRQFENRKKLIDDRAYYNNLSLMQEYEAWKAIQKKYKVGTEERKEADREVYRLKNEINQKLIAINDDYASKVKQANQDLIDGEKYLNAEYERAVSERAQSLSGFAGIFDKVKEASGITGHELMNNLKGQVTTLQTWSSNIQSLARKGVDQGLLAELQKMGPGAAEEIAALSSLTDAQLTEYSLVWKRKNELARNEAVKELEPLKTETSKQIEELRKQTATDLENYKTEWLAAIKEIRYGTANEFVDLNTSMTVIGKNAIKGLTKGMGEMKGPLAAEAKALANSITSTIKSTLKIKSPSAVAMAIGENFSGTLAMGISSNTNKVKDSAKEVLNNFLDMFELPTEDNELHFKAVIDYDKFDKNRLGIQPISVIPDTSFATRNIEAARTVYRQNDNKQDIKLSTVSTADNSPVQPIIIQSILNGRVIAEETFNDTNQLFNNRTNLEFSMRGV